MKWLKRISIAIGILILVGAGSFVLYGVAYSAGEVTGYEDGYHLGNEAGYISGRQEGYDEGYISGEQDGYTEGETAGYDKGYSVGYNLGEQEGYDEGYISGEQDGYTEGYNLGQTDGYISGKQDGLEEGYISGNTDGYQEGYGVGVEAGLGHGYTLRDPTYEEAVTFLAEDKTDKNEYIMDTYGVYVCSHFTRDVCNNAEQEGLRCAFVELRYSEEGHAIIAFNTIDEGLVYFEPQTDEIVKPIVGKRFYQCIEPEPGYYYEPPPYDDTIMDIVVIW